MAISGKHAHTPTPRRRSRAAARHSHRLGAHAAPTPRRRVRSYARWQLQRVGRMAVSAVLSVTLGAALLGTAWANDTALVEDATAQEIAQEGAEPESADSASMETETEEGDASQEGISSTSGEDVSAVESASGEALATGADESQPESRSTALADELSDQAAHAALQGVAQASAGVSANPIVGIGSKLVVPTDEGVNVVYTVVSEGKVELGGTTDEMPATVDYGYSGVLSVPESIRYQGVTYEVVGVGDGAFAPYYENRIKHTCAISQVNISSTVSYIGASAFNGCESLAAVEFADGATLEQIDMSAFQGTNITSISIPASVTELGTAAFKDAPLASITFEGQGVRSFSQSLFAQTDFKSLDFVPSWVTSFGDYCFEGAALTSASVPKTVTSLGAGVFKSCENLVDASFEEGTPLTEIPAFTFQECTGLSSYSFQSFIVSVEEGAFRGSGLASLEVPSTITYLGADAFAECASLETVSFDEDNELMNVSAGLFQGCTALTSVDLPNTVRTLGSKAFQGCTALVEFYAPASLRTIESSVFQECTALDKLAFTGDATYVKAESSSFYRANSLTKVVFYGKKSDSLMFVSSQPTYYYTLSYYPNKNDVGNIQARLSVYVVAAGAVPDDARASQILEGYYSETPENGMWVYESGFAPDTEMTDSYYAYAVGADETLATGDTFTAFTVEGLEVTYTVERAASNARTGLAKVGYDEGIDIRTAVSQSSTGSATIPEKVVGPDGGTYVVDAIAPFAFFRCAYLRTVTFPATVTSIGARAFAQCAMLTNLYFQADASTIFDNSIFAGCGSIKRVVFGGKKANLFFGTSNPDIYYTVAYYASRHDMDIDNRQSTLVVHEHAVLDSLSADDVLMGSVPALKTGFEWSYEEGFGGDIALTDSTSVYAAGMGFQYDVSVLSGNVSKTPCWFRILSSGDENTAGTVQVGLGKDGVTAVHQSVSGTVVIPSAVYDEDGIAYDVVEVGDYAFGSTDEFSACSYLASVSLPAAVRSIGAGAFLRCADLKRLVLPAGLQSLGVRAFAQCPALESVRFANACPLERIPEQAFFEDYALETVILPASLRTIGASAFEGCYRQYTPEGSSLPVAQGLSHIDIPSSVSAIGARAFAGCERLDAIGLPASLAVLGDAAYERCIAASEIRFEGNARNVSIGQGAFYFGSGSSLRSLVFMGKKSPTAESHIVALDSRGDPLDYRVYYNVVFYASTADYESGVAWGNLLIEDDVAVKNYTLGYLSGKVPSLTRSQTWRCESGFSTSERTSDSYYAIAGYDLQYATVEIDPGTFLYTGEFFKPVPVVRWIDGRVLVYGVDYVFDTSVGARKDGYLNNRYGPVAYVQLLGIGDFAGTTTGKFSISPATDSAKAFTVEFDGGTQYVYDGSPKTPRVKVSATLMGEPYTAYEGEDYEVEYRNNVNAGTASAVVRGLGIFGGEYAASFVISPADIRDCEVTALKVKREVVGDDAVEVELSVVSDFGEKLVEGKDYDVALTDHGSVVDVDIIGKGNYAKSMTKRLSYSRFAPSGDPDDGVPGDSDISSSTTRLTRLQASQQTSLSLDATTSEAQLPDAGSGGQNGDRRIYQIIDDAIELVQESEDVRLLLLAVVLAAAGVVTYGAVRRKRRYARDMR